jgi:glycosyltransferase involved in cell wall biosynthesis
MKPFISVIMPTYNRANTYLPFAVQTVLEQTFEQFELIIIDDGSIDKTENVIRSFKDPRIIYIKLANHTGIQTIPRNVGLLLSCGALIAFLDDDCEYKPRHLEILHNALIANPEVAGVYGDRQYVRRCFLAIWKEKPGIDWDVDRLINVGNYIDTSDMLLHRGVLYEIGGWNPYINHFTDWDLLARLARRGYMLLRVPEVITKHNWHWGNLSNNFLRIMTKQRFLNKIQNCPIIQPGLKVASLHLSRAIYTERRLNSFSNFSYGEVQ